MQYKGSWPSAQLTTQIIEKEEYANALSAKVAIFSPLVRPFGAPFESDAELTNAADAYMQTWSGMYDSAMTASAYVHNAVWGHSTSARVDEQG